MKNESLNKAGPCQESTASVARYTQHHLPWDRLSKPKRASLIGRKPSIVANNPDLAALASNIWRHIKDLNKPPFLFRREGKLCRIEADDRGSPVPVNVDVQRAHFFLVESFEWKRPKKSKPEEFVSTRPPKDLAAHIVANPDPPVPILQRIVTAPIFTAAGQLIRDPGEYADGVLYLPPTSFHLSDIPSHPTASDLRAAVDFLKKDLLRDFCFETEAEKDNCIAAIVTPLVREMIDGSTPLFWVDKSKGGAGGTLLSMVIAAPLLGARPAGVSPPRDEAEWNRLILSTLLRSPNVFFIDNCNEYLSSAALASAITATRYEGRIIGSSGNGAADVRCSWLINGNNLRFGWELARRVVRIRIIPGQDGRKFLHANLLAWIIQHRAEVIYHLLVLVNVWLASGRPGPAAGTPAFESFDSWRAVVGGIMNAAGLSFLLNLEDARLVADRESGTIQGFVEAWYEAHMTSPVFTTDLLVIGRSFYELPEGEHSATIRLGLILSKYEDQIHGGWRIRRLKQSTGKTHWQLQPMKKE
jgi:hypothetical protein